jgi:hypothetical protein
VACSSQGDGLYTSCNDITFKSINALLLTYDWMSEIQIIAATNTAGDGSGFNMPNFFQDLFTSVASKILIVVVTIITVLIALALGVFLCRCLYQRLCKSGSINFFHSDNGSASTPRGTVSSPPESA